MMFKILMSACLCGEHCRYDGKANTIENKIMNTWKEEGRIVMVCPEMAGGLPVPRDPAEIIGNKVISKSGRDVTSEYAEGAGEALRLARENDVIFCIMKENSPSCGSHEVYDGTFSGKKVFGMGIAAAMLEENGFRVYNEHQIIEAYRELDEAEYEEEMYEAVMNLRF